MTAFLVSLGVGTVLAVCLLGAHMVLSAVERIQARQLEHEAKRFKSAEALEFEERVTACEELVVKAHEAAKDAQAAARKAGFAKASRGRA